MFNWQRPLLVPLMLLCFPVLSSCRRPCWRSAGYTWSQWCPTRLPLTVWNWKQAIGSWLSTASAWSVWSTTCEYGSADACADISLIPSLSLHSWLFLCFHVVTVGEIWSDPQRTHSACWWPGWTSDQAARTRLWLNDGRKRRWKHWRTFVHSSFLL